MQTGEDISFGNYTLIDNEIKSKNLNELSLDESPNEGKDIKMTSAIIKAHAEFTAALDVLDDYAFKFIVALRGTGHPGLPKIISKYYALRHVTNAYAACAQGYVTEAHTSASQQIKTKIAFSDAESKKTNSDKKQKQKPKKEEKPKKEQKPQKVASDSDFEHLLPIPEDITEKKPISVVASESKSSEFSEDESVQPSIPPQRTSMSWGDIVENEEAKIPVQKVKTSKDVANVKVHPAKPVGNVVSKKFVRDDDSETETIIPKCMVEECDTRITNSYFVCSKPGCEFADAKVCQYHSTKHAGTSRHQLNKFTTGEKKDLKLKVKDQEMKLAKPDKIQKPKVEPELKVSSNDLKIAKTDDLRLSAIANKKNCKYCGEVHYPGGACESQNCACNKANCPKMCPKK